MCVYTLRARGRSSNTGIRKLPSPTQDTVITMVTLHTPTDRQSSTSSRHTYCIQHLLPKSLHVWTAAERVGEEGGEE